NSTKMTSETNFLQSVLITGCSAGGIGSALAETFHERGMHVFATARSISKMAHLEKLPNVSLLELDVTDSKSIESAVEAVTAKTGGKLNYLINNSGQSLVLPALDTSLEDAKKLFDVNVWGVVAVTQAFSPLILATKGTIVNIASLSAFFHSPWLSFYNASKAAVDAYTHTIRQELAPFGVRVVTVAAGTVQTHIFRPVEEGLLPPDSIYKAASEEIEGLASGKLVHGAMPPAEFARKVANDVLGGATGTIFRGTMSTVARVLYTVVPTWLLDRLTFPGSGLNKLS
ncbi:oxidoreductase, partial [Aspergillus bombycis]